MSSEPGVEVELDIFSGRPNPRWMLPAQVAAALRALLRQPIPADGYDPLGLGYRGFIITNLSQDRTIPHKLRVYRLVVTVVERDRESHYQDTQGIEDSLVSHARTLGYGDVIDYLRRAVTKPH